MAVRLRVLVCAVVVGLVAGCGSTSTSTSTPTTLGPAACGDVRHHGGDGHNDEHRTGRHCPGHREINRRPDDGGARNPAVGDVTPANAAVNDVASGHILSSDYASGVDGVVLSTHKRRQML